MEGCDCKDCTRPVWKDLWWLVLSVAGVSILVVGATMFMGYLLGGYNGEP